MEHGATGGGVDWALGMIDAASVNTTVTFTHSFSKQRYLKSQSAV